MKRKQHEQRKSYRKWALPNQQALRNRRLARRVWKEQNELSNMR